MFEWNPEQYLKFEKQRTQPSIDLVNRIPNENPQKILDLGCGTGNSTQVLKTRFQNAELYGIDSSEKMIEQAKREHPDFHFSLFDASDENNTPEEKYDVVFSNACIQWIPGHERLIPRLYSWVKEGGCLAVQFPMNGNEPVYKVMAEVSADPKWGFEQKSPSVNEVRAADEYYNILASLTDNFDVWETKYYHSMPSSESIIEWVKGSRLRPYIEVLDEVRRKEFLNEICRKTEKIYTRQPNGKIIFNFNRFFFIAEK